MSLAASLFDDAVLLGLVRRRYLLPWDGVHGFAHWQRVRENGLRIAEATGARRNVVELFALFHDSQRRNESYDPGHGTRGASFAKSLVGVMVDITPEDLDLLITACRGHSDGLMTGDITVLTCWDADRLDLGRVGIRPSRRRLCTDAARDLLDWAFARSLN